MNLPTEYLFPAILSCSHFDGYPFIQEEMTQRTVYEYEFEFFLRSNGGILIDGRYVPFKAGELNIRKPGQLVQGIAPYESYILCVDFQGDFPPFRQSGFRNRGRSPGIVRKSAFNRTSRPLFSASPRGFLRTS